MGRGKELMMSNSFLNKDGLKGSSVTGNTAYIGELTLPVQRLFILPALGRLAKLFPKLVYKNNSIITEY